MSGATRRPERYLGPRPGVSFPQHANNVVPLQTVVSGEFTTNSGTIPIGVAPFQGNVVDAFISVNNCGRDDSNPLRISGEVYINGTTIFTTIPCINANSEAAGTAKTTAKHTDATNTTTGFDTGVTAGVLAGVDSGTPVSFKKGDVFTAKLFVTRTATPTTEISNAGVVVVLEPDYI